MMACFINSFRAVPEQQAGTLWTARSWLRRRQCSQVSVSRVEGDVLSQGPCAYRHFAKTMTGRSLVLSILGFSALFVMQGCVSENREAQIRAAHAASCCFEECGPFIH